MKNVFLIFKTLMKMIADAICWMLCCHLTYLIIRWFTATPIYDDPSERKEKLSNWNTLFIAISLRIIIWLWWEIYEAWNIEFEIMQKDDCNFAILLIINVNIRHAFSWMLWIKLLTSKFSLLVIISMLQYVYLKICAFKCFFIGISVVFTILKLMKFHLNHR